MTTIEKQNFCSMCGAGAGDFWQTRSNRLVVLSVKPRVGDIFQSWTICNECHGGLLALRNEIPQRPDHIQLLSKIRRATIDDQKAVLNWLQKKFSAKK